MSVRAIHRPGIKPAAYTELSMLQRAFTTPEEEDQAALSVYSLASALAQDGWHVTLTPAELPKLQIRRKKITRTQCRGGQTKV